MVYSMHMPFMLAAVLSKFIYKDLHLSIIVADIPEFMSFDVKKYSIRSMMKNVEKHIGKILIRFFDTHIFLTESMEEYFDIKNTSIIIEGISRENKVSKKYEEDRSKKIIMYAGTIDKAYGIYELIEAFEEINTDYELWIVGAGNGKEYIQKKSAESIKIKFLGVVSREEVLKYQKIASILINPRYPDGNEFTKYSFPSKTIEYMLSGKAIIGYELPGIPIEYFDYIYTLGTHKNKEHMKNIISDICKKDIFELKERGLKGREFIINKKNCDIQVKKILDCITTCNGNIYG